MMAQSALPRGRSWTAGVAGGSGGGSFSASSRWVRSERYRELKHLEQEAKRNMKEMKLLEIEIREQSAGLEKLKKRDAQRVAKIADLSRVLEEKPKPDEKGKEKEEEIETEEKAEGNGGGGVVAEQQASEELQEQLTRLRQEHASIQSTMEETKIALEQKKRELERLEGQHKGLCDQIVKEERALQEAELEESLQQSEAVQHEMRSLSEDLGRLGRLMDGLPPSSLPDQLKQIPMRPQKLRVYHGITSRGTRSVGRNSQEGFPAPEHGRFTSGHGLPSSSRNKEPAEFEEREGGNRKRHKNSSFEQELERLHEQREKLEIEAHEKHMLLESVARFSTQSRDSESGIGVSSRKLSATSQPMLSPSSVFEGFKDTPTLGPARPASTDSSSASSDMSSEDTTVEKPEVGEANSATKRLNIGDSSKLEVDTQDRLQPVGTGQSCISMESNSEDISERDDDTTKDNFGSVAVEDGSVGSCSDIVEEQALTENGLKGGCSPEEGDSGDFSHVSAVEGIEEEDLTTGSVINEIERLEEEVGIWGDGETPEILPNENVMPSEIGTNKHETPESIPHEQSESIPPHEQSAQEEESLSARCHKIRRSLEFIFDSKNAECPKEPVETSLQAVPPSQQHLRKDETDHVSNSLAAQNEESNQAREASATNDDADEYRIWRQNAESQIRDLSSQLSLLHQKVEREVELQDEVKTQEHLEQSSAATEQLSKQVSCFGDEITELRQSMLQMQQNLLKEVESRSSAEHSVEHFLSICTDQSSKLEHLESRVSLLANDLEEQLKLRAELEGKLDQEAQERLKVEAQLKDLSQAVALTASTREEAGVELVEQQKILLVDQLKEAEKLRTVAEVRVFTLDKQVEQLEMVCDVAQNIQEILKFQDKAVKFGLQTLVQLLMLALGVATLYSRVAEAMRGSLIPT